MFSAIRLAALIGALAVCGEARAQSFVPSLLGQSTTVAPSSCPNQIDNGCAASTAVVAQPQIQDANLAVTSAGAGQLPGSPNAGQIAQRVAWLHGQATPGSLAGANHAGWDYAVGPGPTASLAAISTLSGVTGCAFNNGSTNPAPSSGFPYNGTGPYYGGPYVYCNGIGASATALLQGFDWTNAGAGSDTTCVPLYIDANGNGGSSTLNLVNNRFRGHLTKAFTTGTVSGQVLTTAQTMYWFVGETISDGTNTATITAGSGTSWTFSGTLAASGTYTSGVNSCWSGTGLIFLRGATAAALTNLTGTGDLFDGNAQEEAQVGFVSTTGTVSGSTLTITGSSALSWVVGRPIIVGTTYTGTITAILAYNGSGQPTTFTLSGSPPSGSNTFSSPVVQTTGGVFDNRAGLSPPYANPASFTYTAFINLGHIPIRGANAGTVTLQHVYINGLCISDVGYANPGQCHGEAAELTGGLAIRADNYTDVTIVQPSFYGMNAQLNSAFYDSSGIGNNVSFSTLTMANNLVVYNPVNCTNAPDYVDYTWGYGPNNQCTGGTGYGDGWFNINYDTSVATLIATGNICDCTAALQSYRNAQNILGAALASVTSTGTTLTVTVPAYSYNNTAAAGLYQLNPGNIINDPNTADNFTKTTVASLGTMSNLASLTLYPAPLGGVPTVVNGGTGYVVNDVVTFGANFSSYRVATVTSGVVTALKNTATQTPPTLAVSGTLTSTGGTGSGLTASFVYLACVPGTQPGCGTVTLAASEPASNFPTATSATTVSSGSAIVVGTIPSGIQDTNCSSTGICAQVADLTNPNAIPAGTLISSVNTGTGGIALAKALTGTVGTGDTIQFLPSYQTFAGVNNVTDSGNESAGGAYATRLSSGLGTFDPFPADPSAWNNLTPLP